MNHPCQRKHSSRAHVRLPYSLRSHPTKCTYIQAQRIQGNKNGEWKAIIDRCKMETKSIDLDLRWIKMSEKIKVEG